MAKKKVIAEDISLDEFLAEVPRDVKDGGIPLSKIIELFQEVNINNDAAIRRDCNYDSSDWFISTYRLETDQEYETRLAIEAGERAAKAKRAEALKEKELKELARLKAKYEK